MKGLTKDQLFKCHLGISEFQGAFIAGMGGGRGVAAGLQLPSRHDFVKLFSDPVLLQNDQLLDILGDMTCEGAGRLSLPTVREAMLAMGRRWAILEAAKASFLHRAWVVL